MGEVGVRPKESSEVILAVIPGEGPENRLVFASRSNAHNKPIILRQETFSPDVGWFTQSSLEMTRQEMVLLRNAMGGARPSACESTNRRIHAGSTATASIKLAELPVAS